MDGKSTGVMTFSATLTREPDSAATFIGIPFNVMDVWGTTARVAVKGIINGYAFRGSIMPYGGVHYLGVSRDIREAIGAKAGDVVEVSLEMDKDPRSVSIPADLAAQLEAHPAAKIRWAKLSYSHQKEYIDSIEEAKKSETRVKRILGTIEKLTGKKP